MMRRMSLSRLPRALLATLVLCSMLIVLCAEPSASVSRGRRSRTGSAWSAPNTYPRSSPKSSALKDAVELLFNSYEREDPTRLISVVADDFVANDNSGLANRRSEFEQAVRDDFSNLDRISFDQAIVEAVSVTERGTLAVIRTVWTRRARAALTGEEWLIIAERSNLIMRWDGKVWRLILIEGSPVFGLSNRFGKITLSRGTIVGAAASGTISNGRYAP